MTKRTASFALAALLLAASGCPRAGFVEDELAPGLDITRVVVNTGLVQPGQRRVGINVHLFNRTQFPVSEIDVRLRFHRGEADIGSYFAVQADEANVVELARAESVAQAFWVDVFADVELGPVTADATVRGLLPHGDEVGADSALETASFEIVGADAVVVSTAEDEDDIGETVASIEAAGGLLDISLREALHIVNAAGEPQTIRFDPAAFPSRPGTEIDLDPELGLLPPLTNASTIIDGSGSGAIIDGGAIDDGSGLVLAADDITLSKISMRGFNGGEHYHCVQAQDVVRVQIIDSTFIGCGTDMGGGTQVQISGGRDHVVMGCDFTAGRRDGLHVGGSASSALITDNRMIGNADDGMEISGSGHLVTDNLVLGNGGSGAENGTLIESIFRANQFLGSGINGFTLHPGSTGVLIEGSDFVDSGGHGVALPEGSSRITVSQCRFEGNHGEAIDLAPGANENAAPPVVVSFDGIRVEGTAEAEGGTVEVYTYGLVWEYLGSATVSGGAWSLDLEALQPAIVANVTNIGGSTSAFSDLSISGGTDLEVSTAADELDGGLDIVTLAEAGGDSDLSLREAIVLANNWLGPQVITFAPSVFPPGVETTIYIGSAFEGQGPLPTITDDATEIDGSGAGVVLDGGRHPFAADTGALTFAADDCAVRDLTIRNYNAPNGACVYNNDEDRLLVSGCSLSNCGGLDSGAGVRLIGSSSGNLIAGNTIFASYRAIFAVDVSDSVIEANTLSSKAGDCVRLHEFSDANTVVDNWIYGCGGAGVRLSSDTDSALILGNRIYDCGGPAVNVCGDCGNVEVVFNSMVDNHHGVVVSGGAVVQNNIVTGTDTTGLELGANAGITADHNLYFDNAGDGATGASAIAAQTEPDGGVYEPVPLEPSDVIADPQLTDVPGGVMTPGPAAVDQGVDLGYDRNGDLPGLYNGAAPDLGAVETP